MSLFRKRITAMGNINEIYGFISSINLFKIIRIHFYLT